MNDERDRTSSPRHHRLAWSSAIAAVVMALCAPFAGATGIQVPEAPQAPAVLESPQPPLADEEPAPQPPLADEEPEPQPPLVVEEPEPLPPVEQEPLPQMPELPGVDEIVPGAPETETAPIVPEVTTPPVPAEELDGGVDPAVGEVVDEVVGGGEVAEEEAVDGGGSVDEGGGGLVGEVVDDLVGGVVGEVVDIVGGGEPEDEPVDGGGLVDDVVDVVDGGGLVEEIVDEVDEVVGGGPVEEVAEDVGGGGGPVEEVVDGVVGGGGPVEEVVDEVDDVVGDDGPVDEVVDEVTDPEGPVGGVVDEVTDPEGPVGGVVGGVEDGAGSVGDKVGGVVDGVVGGLPNAPDVPGVEAPGDGGVGTGVVDPTTGGGGGRITDSPEDAAVRGERIAATISADGFAANVLAAAETSASTTAFGPNRDVGGPSLVERIARSATEVAQRIAFPLLLALAVGAFVVFQDRVDRRDPKLALAAIDAEEDLLGFE